MSASTERKNRAAAKAAGTDKKTNAALEAEQKARKSKRKWIIGTIAVVLCIALILFLSSPAMYRITKAVSVGSKSYSPAQIQYIRANSKNSMNLGGYTLDYNTVSSYFGEEYAQQLLDVTVSSTLVNNAALLQYAKDNGISLSAQEQQRIADAAKNQMDLLRQGAKANHVSLGTYVSYVFGPGVNEQVLRTGMSEDVLANKVIFDKYCALSFSPEELSAYYTDPADAELFTYMVYQVKPAEGQPAEEAEMEARELVNSYNDGREEDVDPQEAFRDLVAEVFPDESPDLHSSVSGADLEESLRPWLTEEGRTAGDMDLIAEPDGSGWNVVLFVERTANDEPVVAVRHILVKAEANEDGVYTDEAKAHAKEHAEELLAAFEQGDKSEVSFATLAYMASEDSGSRSNGGLYSTVTQGRMVPEFDAFCFADHQYGDTAIVYGESDSYAGYHVMFFVEKLGAGDAAARDALRSEALNNWYSGLVEGLEPVQHWANKLVG